MKAPVLNILLIAGASGCVPSQVFINYGAAPTEMVVSWAMPVDVNGSGTVLYGTSPSTLSSKVIAQQVQYTWTHDTITPDYTSPFLQHALLTNLEASTRYYYTVGGGDCESSAVFSFQSHPGVGADIPLTFCMLGDLGQTNNSQGTLDHIAQKAGGFASILHFGDLSYADGNETRWDTWGDLVQPVASGLPWLTTTGNHEYEYTSATKGSTTDSVAYATRFWAPETGSPADPKRPLYYSVVSASCCLRRRPLERNELCVSVQDVGPVHFLLMDGYTDYSAGSSQHTWVLADLAGVDRTTTPWLIAAFHQPYYNSNTAHAGEGAPLAGIYEDLFFQNGVDLAFSGHVHGKFLRTCSAHLEFESAARCVVVQRMSVVSACTATRATPLPPTT
jgi:acid phosphatase type 7